MVTVAKVRDSTRVIHMFRNNLMESNKPPKIIHRSEDTVIDTNLTVARKLSVADSSHYTGYSLKNLVSKNEHVLLDVEDLGRVYSKLRDAIRIDRPKVIIDRQKSQYAEFEKRMKEDLDFREKILRYTTHTGSNIKTLKHSTTTHSGKGTKRAQSQPDPINNVIQEENEQSQRESKPQSKNSNKEPEFVSPIGNFSFKVKNFRGNKVKYDVIALAKKDKFIDKDKDKKKEAMKRESVLSNGDVVEILRYEEVKEDREGFYEIPIHQSNPFKNKSFYNPLDDEQINLTERMQKRWNLPEWMKFTPHQLRKLEKHTETHLQRMIEQTTSNIVQGKGQKLQVQFQQEGQDLEKIKNLSRNESLVESDGDREYEISLLTSSPIKPAVRLNTLVQKIEERKRIFTVQEPKEVKKQEKKDLIEEVKKRLGELEKKKSGTAEKIHERIHANRFSTMITPYRKPGKPKVLIDDKGKEDRPRGSLLRGQTFDESFDGGKGRSLTYIKSPEGSKSVNLDKKKQAQDKSHADHEAEETFGLTLQKLETTENEPPKITEDINESIFNKTVSDHTKSSHHPRIPSPITRPKTVFKIPEGPSKSQIKARIKTVPVRSHHTVIQRAEVDFEEIEDHLNQTCQDFMKVKFESNNQFQSALAILKKDRPLSNMIRYRNYDSKKMYMNDIHNLRAWAEKERLSRFKSNEKQRFLYTEIVDAIVKTELNEKKLKACIFVLNILKGILERGDLITLDKFNKILDKIDDENSMIPIFFYMLDRLLVGLQMPINMISNSLLRTKFEQYKSNLTNL